MRGVADDGADLVIDRGYVSDGLRRRAEERVTLEIGLRSERDIRTAVEREVDAERWTGLDRQLVNLGEDSAGRVDLRPGGDGDQETRRLLAGRAVKLEQLGLATREGPGVWTIDPGAERTLRDLSVRNDIIKTMHRAMTRDGGPFDPSALALHSHAPSDPILGRLIARGLHDELTGMLDKTDATKLLTKIRRQWFAKRKSVAAILKEVMTNEQSVLMDSDASNKAADADMALQELGADHAGIAYVTATVTVWDRDPALAVEKLRLVEKVIQGRDFTCTIEGMNAIEAWLGSLPGHVYANVRQPPISTLNLAHLIPLSAVWAGAERDEHFGDAPLLYGKTEGSTPFRLSLHVGDVGHSLIVGPTGAGKSVLLALMALQFRRYPGSQIFAFDFGGSIRAAALGMGGDWQDLGGALSADEDDNTAVALQPLACIDNPGERAWAAEWLAALFAGEGVHVDPAAKEHLWSALTSLASAPPPERTLTGLAVLLQSQELKQALSPYLVGGPWGRLLDAEQERLGEASVQAFETEGLIGASSAAAVLAYLFHRIEGRLDGSPTMIIIDEGWLVLDSPAFAAQLREWLKTLRKKNASVIFATQSLADIETSAIAPAIIESCPTRIFLPNERAAEPQIAKVYERFGLNGRQIEILSRATPKRDYYCQSRRGNRLFELGLGEVALAFSAASSKSDQLRIAELVAAHGRDGFAAALANDSPFAPVAPFCLADGREPRQPSQRFDGPRNASAAFTRRNRNCPGSRSR